MRFTTPRARRFAAAAAAAALIAIAAFAGGCNSSGRRGASVNAAPAAAIDAATLQAVRDRYDRAYPQSRVGVVIATLRDEPLAAVAEIPRDVEFQPGEIATFIDGRGRVLTTGTVVRVLPDSIHVRFARPPRDGRAPRRGDVALLRLPAGAATL